MTDQPAQPVSGEPNALLPRADQTPSTPDSTGSAVPEKEVPDQSDPSGLPEGVKERTTREFEKLKGSNSELAQQLREERAKRQYAESVFQQFTPKPPAPPKAAPIVDPTTGLLNERALTDLQQQALTAHDHALKAEAQLQQYQLSQERKEAYSAHPELNPEGKTFDKELSIETRKVLLDNMTHPEDYDGRQLSFREAADFVKERFKPMVDKAQQAGAKDAIEQITPKEQAALAVTGTQPNKDQLNTDEMESLRFATRKGGNSSEEAIVQRMRALTQS